MQDAFTKINDLTINESDLNIIELKMYLTDIVIKVKVRISIYLEQHPLSVYGGMSLGILVTIGLASLFGWKLMTEARDREEYETFIAKAKEENEEILNQCYTAPTTTFRNPMFKRSFR